MVSSFGGGGEGVRVRSGLDLDLPARRGAELDLGLNFPAEGFRIPFVVLAPWLSDMLVIEMAESIEGSFPDGGTAFFAAAAR